MRKNIKALRAVICALLVVLLCLSFTACDAFDNEEVRGVTDDFLQAMIENDEAGAYALVKDSYAEGEDEFHELFLQYRELLSGVESYELKAKAVNVKMDNGSKMTSVDYEMEANSEKYVLEVTVSSTSEGIYGIYINTYESAVAAGDHVVEEFGVLSIVFIAMLLAEIAFMVVMIIDCAKRKMKYKVLLMLAIILGWVTVNLRYVGGELLFHMNVLGVVATYINLYSDASFRIAFSLPVGAIAYLALRKKSIALYEEEQERERKKAERAAKAKALANDRKLQENEELDIVNTPVTEETAEKAEEKNNGEDTL